MMIWDQGGYDEPDMYQVTRTKINAEFYGDTGRETTWKTRV
jgi:hypothetical protein